MKTTNLVRGNWLTVGLAAAAWLAAGSGVARAGVFGSVIELPGHISEIAVDEARGLLYAANFTAGKVDVISTSSNRLVSSMNLGGQPSGLALSPDGRFLVVTNYNNFEGVGAMNSVAVVNLTDLTRQNYATTNPPLAVAFGADGVALVITTSELLLFRPASGTFERLITIASMATSLPVVDPKFPREITTASITASGDGNYIFGVTDTFLFSFQVPYRAGFLNVRATSTLLHPLAPPLATASFDGSYFMAGQYVFDRRLRVIAEQPDTATTELNLGGHTIDFGLKTIYSYFPLFVPSTNSNGNGNGSSSGNGNGSSSSQVTPLGPVLFVQDADNLTVRDRLNLRERITGRMILAGAGRFIYAVSDSGVLYLPLTDLAGLPQIRANVEQLFFQFDYCQRSPLRTQFQIRGSGDFDIRATLPGISFSPSSGTAPATVDVIVDFGAYSTVQGTTFGEIFVSSTSALNVISPIQLSINVKDADQRGRVVPIPGKLVDLLADPGREQFYVLEQTKNELHVFNNNGLRLMGTFRTGNQPTWMGLSADRRNLMIANSSGENITVLNLDTMQNEGLIFMPPGHHPVSVAADNGTVLVAVRTSAGGKLDWVELGRRTAFDLGTTLGRPGVYQNTLHLNTVMVPTADLTGIIIAEPNGKVKRWDSANQEVVLARQDVTAWGGALAAGPSAIVVGNNILNHSLVPQATFGDLPNLPAGFVFAGDAAVRTSAPTGLFVDTGAVQRLDVRRPTVRQSPVRLVEQPPLPATFPFLRSLAALRNGVLVSTSSSGLVELPGNFDAGIAIPRVSAITASADFSDALAAGSLVTIFGQNLAPETATGNSLPLSTSLGQVCVTVNGIRLPLLYVSPGQINGQLPFSTVGRLSTVLHTPGGLSDTYFAEVRSAAPAVFQLSVSGQPGTYPAVVRARNNQLTTLSNPLRPNETFLVFASGLGEVGPAVPAGSAAPLSPLAVTRAAPVLTLGDTSVPVVFAGLVPGFVGLYQINAVVPPDAPLGLQIPLKITAGTSTTTVNVRLVE